MGKLARQLRKELGAELGRVEKEIRGVLLNARSEAIRINESRVDTGFMINNWFISKTNRHPEIKNPGDGSFPTKVGLTARNISSWNFGENIFLINNTEYASYHDLGTIHITPLFISFQVEHYIERHINRIKT